jgi:predicted O-methyltransferase YrrM
VFGAIFVSRSDPAAPSLGLRTHEPRPPHERGTVDESRGEAPPSAPATIPSLANPLAHAEACTLMHQFRLVPPITDPTPIFEHFRGSYGAELLTAAVAHFDVFDRLATGPKTFTELRMGLGLDERPANVLITGLRAMGLITSVPPDRLALTEVAREHLTPESELNVRGYLGLAADSPGVCAMVERLRTNRPGGASTGGQGAAFIFRDGIESAMERESSARQLTMSLAGRAKNVAPLLAQRYPIAEARLLLDVGGGTGIYAIAYLQSHPELRAIVWDRPEVLKVAHEMAQQYGVSDRLECHSGDMFTDPVPHGADVILVSNILHDWDIPECRTLLGRLSDSLTPGKRLLIHDVFLSDALDGPLPVALYSAALFSLTEGRAYSAGEYRTWLTEVGLSPREIVPTLIHCGVLPAFKSN